MEVNYVKVKAEDGTEVEIGVPVGPLPSDERADELRALYREHVKHPHGRHGPAWALVPTKIADDVAEAMDFIGDIVDEREDWPAGQTFLRSDGYSAHGF